MSGDSAHKGGAGSTPFDDDLLEDTSRRSIRRRQSGDLPAKRASLVVLRGDRIGHAFPIRAEVTIGRLPNLPIVLGHEGVSRRHARIVRDLNGYLLEDLDSRNGTVVNGKMVKRHRLSDGDRIQLGAETTLLFALRDPAEEQLAQQQRAQTASQVAASIAHDFNNLLAVIATSLEYLDVHRSSDDPETRECVADAREATSQASVLAKKLMTLGRTPQRGNSEPVLPRPTYGGCVQVGPSQSRRRNHPPLRRTWISPGAW